MEFFARNSAEVPNAGLRGGLLTDQANMALSAPQLFKLLLHLGKLRIAGL